MNRIVALLIPLAMLGSGALRSGLPAKVDPQTLAKAWSASVAAEASSDLTEAAKQLSAFAQGGGDRYLTQLRAGWIEYGKGNYQAAGEHYSQAAKTQPGAIAPLAGMLNAALQLNDGKKIAAAAEALLRVEPTNYSAMMALANMAYHQQDNRKASQAYRRVLVTYPGDLAAMSGASWAAFNLGDKHNAHEGFIQILSISADYPLAQRGFDLSSEGLATR